MLGSLVISPEISFFLEFLKQTYFFFCWLLVISFIFLLKVFISCISSNPFLAILENFNLGLYGYTLLLVLIYCFWVFYFLPQPYTYSSFFSFFFSGLCSMSIPRVSSSFSLFQAWPKITFFSSSTETLFLKFLIHGSTNFGTTFS